MKSKLSLTPPSANLYRFQFCNTRSIGIIDPEGPEEIQHSKFATQSFDTRCCDYKRSDKESILRDAINEFKLN